MLEGSLEGWMGEEIVARFDEPTGAWMFVAIHDTTLGPGMGGTRLASYRSQEDALGDVLRLSQAMTLKQAVAELPYGGGKAVLAVRTVPPTGSNERRRVLLRYAELVDALRGRYVTAADMNTDERDMDVIGEQTSHVLGRSRGKGGSGDPGKSTALGVLHGLRSACLRAFGSQQLQGLRVLVQGIGVVGSALVGHLREAGADVVVSDVDRRRAEVTGCEVVGPEEVVGTSCDVFAPCARGGILSAETIRRLRCRVVAGAANNQLAEPDDAARLRDAGILYAPDFVINAGGVIHLAGYETLGWDQVQVAARLRRIGDTLTTVFETAEREDITTDGAARTVARARIGGAGEPAPSG